MMKDVVEHVVDEDARGVEERIASLEQAIIDANERKDYFVDNVVEYARRKMRNIDLFLVEIPPRKPSSSANITMHEHLQRVRRDCEQTIKTQAPVGRIKRSVEHVEASVERLQAILSAELKFKKGE